MQTITIDIINEKALNLLKDLELLKLVRLHREENDEIKPKMNWSDYKGSMSKQPLNIVEDQLKDLRKEWD